jgi:outer membrane protein TolC
MSVLLVLALVLPACAERVSLGVEHAINKALETNLRTRLAQERIVEAESVVTRAEAAFSPTFSVEAGQYNRSVNLAAQGLSGSDLPIPTRIGPFFSFESRLQVLYKLYDAQRSWTLRGSEIEKRLAQLRSEMEGKAITVLTSGTYIMLLEAQEKERVSRADVELAQRLETQAANLEIEGVAAGVDRTRAQTRLAQRQLQVTQDQEQVRTLQRQLLRLTGLPLTDELSLEDDLLHIANPFPALEDTVALAREARLEVRLAQEKVALMDNQIHRSAASDAPSVELVGSAGMAGNTPTDNASFVHNVGVSLSWSFFDGGRTEAEIEGAKSRKRQADMELDDTLIQVEAEVRDAYSLLLTAQQSMNTAEQGVALANQELAMSQDRFQVGLTNNVELMQSEEALVEARYSQLRALANYNIGLIRLASASGRPDLLLQAFQEAKEKGATDE